MKLRLDGAGRFRYNRGSIFPGEERAGRGSVLCLLALFSAALTAWTLRQQAPERIAAFQDRFQNLSQLDISASNGVVLAVEGDTLEATWEESADERIIHCGTYLICNTDQEVELSLYAGGTQNASRQNRWGYQVWLEAESLDAEGELVTSARMELARESDKERNRPYTLAFQPGGQACSIRVRIRVTPLDGSVASGSLTISNWEVFVR